MAESYGEGSDRAVVNQTRSRDERSVPELMKELSDQTVTLVRQELDLAKAELTAKGKRAGLGAGMFGGASLFGAYALAALTACAILALTQAVDGWLAALIVAGALGVIAGALALTGLMNVKRGVPPTPQETLESVKEDIELTKLRAKEGRQ